MIGMRAIRVFLNEVAIVSQAKSNIRRTRDFVAD